MSLNILYNNITRINHGILLKYLYVYLIYSKYSLAFVNFLKVNGIINNYVVKNNTIIVFFKFSQKGLVLQKIMFDRHITLWRWYRFKRIVSFKSLFSKRYKKNEMFSLIFYTSKGFLFFETAYWLGIGGRYLGQIKLQ